VPSAKDSQTWYRGDEVCVPALDAFNWRQQLNAVCVREASLVEERKH